MNEPQRPAEVQALRVLWTLFAQTYLDTDRLPAIKAVHAACSTLAPLMESGKLAPESPDDDLFVARLLLAIEEIDDALDTAAPCLLDIARRLRDLHSVT